MTYPEIKLVDGPTASAAVLFDFNDVTATPRREVTADDFTIGTPEVEGDVDAVDPLYSDRMVSFVCAMTGAKPQVAAVQSALSRRLLAPGQGWLSIRMTPTSRLLFFRTYRPQPGDLSFEFIKSVSTTAPDRWELEVNLPCEPFAYGERVTQTTQTVSNDPATGTNPCRIVLPAITGDAPTNLRVQVSGASVDQVGYRHMFALTSAATARTPTLAPIGSGDSVLTLPAYDTGAPVTDSTYSGGSYRATTFATSTAIGPRLTITTPPMLPGRYKILVRIARPRDAATRFSLAASFADAAAGSGSLGNVGPITTTNPTDTGSGFNATWVDLGVLAHLPRSDPATTTPRAGALTLYAGRTGTGDLRWDAVLLIPVSSGDGVSGTALFGGYTGGTYAGSGGASGGNVNTFDGDSESFWSNAGAASIELSGTFPTASPDGANVLTVLTHVNPRFNASFPSDSVTSSIQVAVSYMPRFLYIGDS